MNGALNANLLLRQMRHLRHAHDQSLFANADPGGSVTPSFKTSHFFIFQPAVIQPEYDETGQINAFAGM